MQVEKVIEANAGNSLENWEISCRKYYNFFETQKDAQQKSIQRCRTNPLTKWRDPIALIQRLKVLDSLRMRQMLGEISKTEANEICTIFSKEGRFCLTRSKSDSAKIFALRKNWFIVALSSFGILGYTRFLGKQGLVWYPGAFIPLLLYTLYNIRRQPLDVISNSYRFILAKRTAICQMELFGKKFQKIFNETVEGKRLQNYMTKNQMSIYDLETSLVNQIQDGKFIYS